MKNFGGHLKLEAFANTGSSLGPDLLEEISALRKAGDYSQSAMENSKITEIFKAHLGMNVTLYVNEQVGFNALAKFATLDNNHPFFKSSGFEPWFSGDIGTTETNKGPVSGAVDRTKYKVSGIFSEVECPIMLGLALMKSKKLSNEHVTAVLLHEVGHHFTYFEYIGGFINDAWLISNASKIAAGSQPPEVKQKVLIRTKEQLGIEKLDIATMLTSANSTRKDEVELVLVSNSLIVGTSQSATTNYDTRVCEQLADAFVAYNGYGRHLAEALVIINKEFHTVSARGPILYLVAELFKTVVTLWMLINVPISAIIWLVAMVPGAKVYDDPEARLNTLKQQLNMALKQTKDDSEKRMIVEDIKSIEIAMKELKDKRTFYTAIYETITPIGRKRHNQEKQQEFIKTMLFNDFQAKAIQMRS